MQYHKTIVVSILLSIFKHPKFVIWSKSGRDVNGDM